MKKKCRAVMEMLEGRTLMSASTVVANAVSFGGSGDDRIVGIATDAAGNIFATGFFFNSVTIGGTTLNSNAGSEDMFVCKISNAGAVAWAFSIGSATGDEPTNLLVDPAGNVYISAYYSSDIDADPGAGTHTLTANGVFNSDAFIAKYDASGNFQWASAASGPSYDTAGKLLRDPSTGDILWNGTFTGTVTFSGGLNSTQLTAATLADPFLARFDSAGTLVNVTQNFNASAVDANGNIYTAWNLSAAMDIDPGAGTTVVTPAGSYAISFAKYDSSLNLLWHKDLNGVYAAVYDLAIDSQGNWIAVGDFAQAFQFDPAGKAALVREPASPDAFSAFVLKLNASGKYQWVTPIKGKGGWSDAWAVKVDALDNIYVGGDFNGRVNFSRNTVSTRAAQGDDDGFVAKYSPAGALKWVKTIGGDTYDRVTTFDFSSSGRIVAGGYISGTVNTDAGTLTTDGSNDAFYVEIAPPTTRSAPIGRFDVANSNLISGVAIDPDDGTAALTVRIFIDGILRNTQTADIDRGDLITAQNFPPVTTTHGFSYVPPALSAGWHNVAVFAVDSTTGAAHLIARKLVHF